MAGGGGAWKVAYADFVTAMMAFFLVMWLVSSNKPAQQAIAEYFNDPYATGKAARSNPLYEAEGAGSAGPFSKGKGPGLGNSMTNRKSDCKPGAKNPAATKPSRMIIVRDVTRTRTIGTSIWFPDDAVELNDEAREQLDSLLPLVQGTPNKIEVRSLFSRRPLPVENTFENRWQFSHAQCQSTMQYLIDHGIERERFLLSQAAEEETPAAKKADPKKAAPIGGSYVEVFAIEELFRRKQ